VRMAARSTPRGSPRAAPIRAVMMLSWRIIRRSWRRLTPTVPTGAPPSPGRRAVSGPSTPSKRRMKKNLPGAPSIVSDEWCHLYFPFSDAGCGQPRRSTHNSMNSRPCPQIRSGTRVLGHQRCPLTPARPVEDPTAANRSKNNRRRCIPGGSRGLDSQYGVAGTRDSKIWAQLDRRHGAIVVPLSTTALRWRLGPERRASPGGPPSARRGTGSSVGAPAAGRNSFAPRGGGPSVICRHELRRSTEDLVRGRLRQGRA
jgi:hypothetical protein